MTVWRWLQRIERQRRKHRRQIIRRNVQAYRRRKAAAGYRRIDVVLTPVQFEALAAWMQPGESYSAAIGRLITAITGRYDL